RNDYRDGKYQEFIAGRRAAAATIDIETCDYCWAHVDGSDPYGFHGDCICIGREYFVMGPDSAGPICVSELSDAQRAALDARIDRNRKLGLGNGDLLNEPNTPARERAAEEAAKEGHPFRTPNWVERMKGLEAGSHPLPRGID